MKIWSVKNTVYYWSLVCLIVLINMLLIALAAEKREKRFKLNERFENSKQIFQALFQVHGFY